MKKIISLLILLFFCATNDLSFAFTLSDKDRTALLSLMDLIPKINQQLQSIKADLTGAYLPYGIDWGGAIEIYKQKRLEMYRARYGPDFQISPEMGQGQLPDKLGDAKILHFINNWKIYKFVSYLPYGVIQEFSFFDIDRYHKFVVTVTFPNTGNFIVAEYDLDQGQGKILNARIQQVDFKLNKLIGSFTEKSKQKVQTRSKQKTPTVANITDSYSESNSLSTLSSTKITAEKSMSTNLLIQLLDEYLNSSIGSGFDYSIVTMNTLCLGQIDRFLAFLDNKIQEDKKKSKIKGKH